MRGRLRRSLYACTLLLAGCATLPPPVATPSVVLEDARESAIGRAITEVEAQYPGESGIYLLDHPLDAFAARAVLAGAAERSLDVQYYIWHDDRTGRLVLDALWEAAERGVRVRLLLDDLPTAGLDRILRAFDAHPNAEVRLYNPWVHRKVRYLDWIRDFRRMHRRMHNKSFTADNALSILGGRNIGNEYFGLGDEMQFADLDLVATGAVVEDVSRQFDLYWNSRSAYPVEQLIRDVPEDERRRIRARIAATREQPASQAYIEAVRKSPLVRDLEENRTLFRWMPAQLVYDDPSKTRTSSPREESLLMTDMLRVVGQPERSFDLVSPYFVPGRPGTETLKALADRGVRVRILTNSLAATDVPAVHAGYIKSRRPLLRSGIELYEFHPIASRERSSRAANPGSDPEDGGRRRTRAALSLHSKTFAVDSTRLFIGSLNFDPRSVLFNTELGIVLESAELSKELHDDFARDVPLASYEVRLGAGGLEWVEMTATGMVTYRSEPRASALRRLAVSILRWLPIDWLL